MLGKLLAVFGLLTSFSLWSIPNKELISNLTGRMHPLAHNQGYLIKSFTHHSQSYIYDQALAVIAMANEGDKKNSQLLLKGLETLQMKDGSLYFSYYLDGTSPYPIEGDKRYAGAIAWVSLAASHYQNKFKSTEFVSFNKNILKYLKTQIDQLEIKGQQQRAVRFGPSDIKTTQWQENHTVALEHNLDAYAAYLHYSTLNNSKAWTNEIKDLKKFILSMWDKNRSHFWSGANVKTGLINKDELYLDNQSWSLLALDKKTLSELKTSEALDMNCELFYVEHEGVAGFMDSKPVSHPAKSKFVWSEGSAGQILAMNRMNESCRDKTSGDFLKSIKNMKKSDGGIGYSTTTSNPDFTTSSSVAGTSWYYFASNNFNPFHLKDP